jgi:hypothetical protein
MGARVCIDGRGTWQPNADQLSAKLINTEINPSAAWPISSWRFQNGGKSGKTGDGLS